MCVHAWVVGRAGVLLGGLRGRVWVRESGRAEGAGWTRGVGEGTVGARPSDSNPTPAAIGPCVRAERKGGGALGSLSSPLCHLCLPVTCYVGSKQRTGAEVWLRRATGPGPPPQAAVTAHPAPPCLLEGRAPPLGPWASPGAHSLSPPEQTVSQETSSPSVRHGVLDPSPTPKDPPGSHPRLQLRLALPRG